MARVRSTTERLRLRQAFEEAPELYDRARPTYPPELFDDLVTLGRIPDGGRILELGPGTGKATLPLAERGFEIVGLELGADLASLARSNLAGFQNVKIVNEPFERWATTERFDGVVAFTSFHWIDPEVKYEKSARLLREDGALAVAGSRHVMPENGDPFWAEVQDDYDAVVPSEGNKPPPSPDDVYGLGEEIDASGHFRHIATETYLRDIVYTADGYVALLDTYSGHRTIPEPQRVELYERIRARIGSGTVRKSYLFMLNVAIRLSG
jgi:SAM-dependent methyltransferase